MAEQVQRFEDLVAWQKARELAGEVYQLTREGKFEKDVELSRQVKGAAISVMSQTAEGFERRVRGEFHQFLADAKSACADLRSCLYLALDAGYVEQAKFDSVMAKAEEMAKTLGGLRFAVERQRRQREAQGQQ